MYRLSEWPLVETLTVTVDGVEVYDWVWHTDNEIQPDPPPPPGAEIEVRYVVMPEC